MLSLLQDILFPSRCAGCGAAVGSHQNYLCPPCTARIKVLSDTCPVCSTPLNGSRCTVCDERHWYISKNITLSDYSGIMKSVICKMKFDRIRALHAALGTLALQELARRSVPADIITWVPMSLQKRWDRGFNQSELISKFISKKIEIPCRQLLKERPGTRAQRKLGLRDRFINSLNRYEAAGPGSIPGRRVLIIDDVYTTGATINECARQLLLAGADRVFSLTIARTDTKRLEKF